MKKITESEKEYALYSVRVKASSCKPVYNDIDLASIKIYFIEGLCAGLLTAGIKYESYFVKELYNAWDNEPPYIK